MIEKPFINQLMSRLQAYQTPILSIYVNVNPEQRAGGPRAIVLQVKSALEELDEVPGSIKSEVLSRLGNEIPSARTLAIFATASSVEVFPSPVELPLQDPQTGRAEVRWGEPHIVPLALAMQPHPSYGVVFLELEHWRCFEVARGTIEEVADDERPPVPSDNDVVKASPNDAPNFLVGRGGVPFPGWLASRGEAAKDRAQHHTKELSRRFYLDVAHRLQDMMAERKFEHLIVIGPERDVARFRSTLPPVLKDRVAAVLPSLPNPQCAASEVMAHVASAIEDIEERRQGELLAEIRERGITGLDKCLSELQRGRVHTVAVPWNMDRSVFREVHSGYVATTAEGARTSHPDDAEVREVPLRVMLPELACEYNTRIELVQGSHEERVVEDFGGMGALTRW